MRQADSTRDEARWRVPAPDYIRVRADGVLSSEQEREYRLFHRNGQTWRLPAGSPRRVHCRISEGESAFLPHRYRERRQRHTRCPAAEGWNRQLPAFQRADSVRLCMRDRGSASCHCPVRFDSTDRIRFTERKGHRAKVRLCAPACGEEAAEQA